jgi:branched-subunit amino acid aminotransferase/4-amino-4-deoxychorismate lyase
MLETLTPADEFWWASAELTSRLQTDPASILRERGYHPPADMPLPILHEFIRIAHLLWVDGRVVSLEQFRIDPADEGLLFGRGVWESTRTIQGKPWLWNWHAERMIRTAELLGIPLAPTRLPSEEQITQYVRLLGTQDVVLRLNATAGRPGFPGIVWMSAAPLPAPTPYLRLKTQINPVMKAQPYLALKTFQYATRLRLGQQVQEAGFDSALMVDERGVIQEAAHANLFFRLPEGWRTPKSDGTFLPGTMRQLLLQKAPVPILEDEIPLTTLARVSEIFATNSNVGIVPIVQVDATVFPIGPDTRYLMQWLNPPEPPGVQYRFQQTHVTPR